MEKNTGADTDTRRAPRPTRIDANSGILRTAETEENAGLSKALLTGAAVVIVLVGAYWALTRYGGLAIIGERIQFKHWIDGLGSSGPFVVIGAMTLAIVFSPIPSAPIALAAGAAYGHGWGTLYILLGSELGALGAFFISRLAGHELLRYWLGDRLNAGLLGSQRTLMATVFLSRLMPFISFDVISYAAGLTTLKFWRFAVATLAGILPASFLLAHFGSELSTGELPQIAITLVVLGGITLIPMGIGLLRKTTE